MVFQPPDMVLRSVNATLVWTVTYHRGGAWAAYTAGIRRAELRLRNSLPTFRNRGACLGDAIALDLSPSPFAYAVRFA
jgi:hypothetical protein